MNKTNFELVKEFHEFFRLPINYADPSIISRNRVRLRLDLIKEEYIEVLIAMNSDNLQDIAKELADLLYVTYGTAVEYGIPLDDVFHEVHESNMSKLDVDGQPIFREDDKVLKGPLYREANIKKVFEAHALKQS